ncbi:ATP-binding cassette domain-containing protein [Desulforamulus aeronauticus]|uniref:ABC-2 type transport system ATP-binding protein n=1 Tax=Desulforamulus aeronauticus DSM 10349 TaxID=1121421 RepID=A0A1M6V5E3_9FIRM|nr:ABC transporter ATP-binding protein [Desulforamulus aeronauticus]SHK76673.1 ABC-2 type transport system ATP-binding protein [Desulforamulus aeronauticus DSM 10349]
MQPVIVANDVVQVVTKKTVLNGISLQVNRGETLGIFGTKGTGKTTLLHILAGLDRFKSGTVEILGYDVRKSDKYKGQLGLVTQEKSLFQELKVAENLDFIATLRGGNRTVLERLVTQLKLQELLAEPVSTLDNGLYQRVALACALLHQPTVLIADELIKDIDLASRHLILLTIRQFLQEGGTLVCGFSNLDYAHQLNRVAWLADGTLNFYSPAELEAEWQRQIREYAGLSGERHD